MYSLFRARGSVSIDTEMEFLESDIEHFKPILATTKSHWRPPEEVHYAIALDANSPAKHRLLVYLDTADPRHDGGTTYRRCTYDVSEKAFVCEHSMQQLVNVSGFMILGGDA